MTNLLDKPCLTGQANFFNDSKCRLSFCVDCIIEAESQTDDIQLDTYGISLILNSVMPLDFTPNK